MGVETFRDVNYPAVLVAAIGYFAVGGIWYSPALFSRAWMRASGVRPEEGGNPAPLFALSFALGLLTSLALAFLAEAADARSAGDGLLLGLLAGLGFAAPALVVTQAFERRPPALHGINPGYHVVATLVAALIVTLWR